jgi:histidyl-tRNA synthetase
LEWLGFSEVQTRELLGAVDKFENMGDDAFKSYLAVHGSLDPDKKEKIVAFSGIKELSKLKDWSDQISKTAHGALVNLKIAARMKEWINLLGGLEAMGLARFVEVDLGVVRGLAYYTGFVFEAYDRKGELRAIAGGGRYNDLVAKLGGPGLPAVGFAMGDVTLGLLLESRGLMPAFVNVSDIYCVIGGETERRAAFADIQALRAAGYRVDYPIKDVAFGKQFKFAGESGAKLALIYGAEEVARGIVKVRDLADRTEQEVPRDHVMAVVRGFFSGG